MNQSPSTSPQPWTLLAFSADTTEQLDQLTTQLHSYLEQHPEHALAEVARALPGLTNAGAVGRAVVCADRIAALDALAEPGRTVTGPMRAGKPSVAFVFPGLGEQYFGMASGLYRREPVFRNWVDTCAELAAPWLEADLRDVLGLNVQQEQKATPKPKLDLRSMLRRGAADEDLSPLHRTDLAQPATFVIEYALAQLWQSWGITPNAMLGYSIGEYVAACLADVLSLPDALRLVVRRARLIQGLPAGAMLAVPRPESAVAPLLGDELSLAAVNGEDLCVVAGPLAAIDALEASLIVVQEPVVRIPTTHAFHSKMMVPIVPAFEEALAGITLRSPRIPYLSNVSGTWITDAQATDPAYWVAHLCQPVRCAQGLRELWRNPERVFLEVGPGRALGTLAAHNAPPGRELVALTSLRASYETISDKALLLNTVGRLWLLGAPLQWDRVLGQSHDAAGAQALREHLSPAFNEAGTAAPQPATPKPLQAEAGSGRQARPQLFTAYAAPRNALEQELAALWQRVLKIDAIGVHDNFFELGGHSLLAIFVLNQLEGAHGKLALQLFFDHPTVARFAEALAGLGTQFEAASAPSSSAPSHVPYVLPNGLQITHQNKAETDHFYQDIFEHRTYVRHLDHWPASACVFDVGGNIGLFSLFVHTLDPRARIYTFEPSAPTFAILKRNVEQLGVNAKLFEFGLSDAERTVDFTFYPLSSGMSSVYGDRDEEEAVLRGILQNQQASDAAGMEAVMAYSDELLEQRLKSQTLSCQLRTLSSVIREERVERIDLLKIDVQKSELDVLMGIEADDWKKIRAIAIEVHDLDGRVAVVERLLRLHGYEVESEQDELYRGTGIYLIYAKRSADDADACDSSNSHSAQAQELSI